ncbi:hypothetical protein SO802_009974 [Lithocarpus litseifolius]|uniref:Uncharacterized protein n=1 Tax=Lithocarpus litseifolius TaxID=425828 RepID=A0AAW2DDH2_9ROSI
MALRPRNSKGANVPLAASEPVGENEVASKQRNEAFHKKLREGSLELTQKELEVQRNPLPNHKGKGVVAVVIHGNPAKTAESERSFHPSTVRTLQKNPKFRSLFNQLGFGPEARRVATESLMSIAADSGMECFTVESHAS